MQHHSSSRSFLFFFFIWGSSLEVKGYLSEDHHTCNSIKSQVMALVGRTMDARTQGTQTNGWLRVKCSQQGRDFRQRGYGWQVPRGQVPCGTKSLSDADLSGLLGLPTSPTVIGRHMSLRRGHRQVVSKGEWDSLVHCQMTN